MNVLFDGKQRPHTLSRWNRIRSRFGRPISRCPNCEHTVYPADRRGFWGVVCRYCRPERPS